MLIIVGASASGKTCIVKNLYNYGFEKIVTYTTRPKRDNETEGVDYHFITREDFLNKIKAKFFLEYVTYQKNYYGTSKESLSENKVVILEPTGLAYYRKFLKDEAYVVYLTCDKQIRLERMTNRGDELSVVLSRIDNDEQIFKMSIGKYCDYILDTSHLTVDESTKQVLEAYRQRRKNEK